MALALTTVAKVLDVDPKIGSDTTLSSAQIVAVGERVEALIFGKVARLYSLPFAEAPNLLVSLATELTIYKLLTQRILVNAQLKDSDWPDRFKDSFETLDQIATGKVLLVDSAGAMFAQQTNYARVNSTTKDYQPSVAEGLTDPLLWQVDNDRVTDDEADRNI